MAAHPDGSYWPTVPTLAEYAEVDALASDDAQCHALAADPWLDMIDLDTYFGPLANGDSPLARPDGTHGVKRFI